MEDKKEAVIQEAADLIREFADKLAAKLKEYPGFEPDSGVTKLQKLKDKLREHRELSKSEMED